MSMDTSAFSLPRPRMTVSSIQSPRLPRTARTNSSASSTDRSSLVTSNATESTRVNRAARWDL
jgi:hypothetical protein